MKKWIASLCLLTQLYSSEGNPECSQLEQKKTLTGQVVDECKLRNFRGCKQYLEVDQKRVLLEYDLSLQKQVKKLHLRRISLEGTYYENPLLWAKTCTDDWKSYVGSNGNEPTLYVEKITHQ